MFLYIHTLFDNACCNIVNTTKWDVPNSSSILPLLCGSHCKTSLNHWTIFLRRQLKFQGRTLHSAIQKLLNKRYIIFCDYRKKEIHSYSDK